MKYAAQRAGTAFLIAALWGPAAWSMDLLQAWQAALENDATILAARAGTAARVERLPQAYAQLLPNISGNFSRTKNDLTSTQPGFLGGSNTTENSYYSGGQTISLRQPLYRPFQSALYRQAQAEVDDANATLARDTQNVAVRVAAAYFEALLAKDQMVLIGAQKRSLTSQLDSAEKGFKAGTGTRTDIDEAQSRLDLILAQELEAAENVDFTRRQLEVIVGRSVDTLSVLDPAKMQLTPPAPTGLAGWVEKAEKTNPDLQALQAQVEIARQEVDKAEAGHHPSLDLVAQRSRSQSENVTSFQSKFDNTSFGLQLVVPLYSGGGVEASIRQALANLERAQQTLEAGRRDLAIRVQREYRGINEGVLRVRALEQAVRSSDTLVTSTRKSFQAGSRTAVDILNAEQQRTLASRDLSQARYIYLISRIRLQALVAGIDEAGIQEINAWLVAASQP